MPWAMPCMSASVQIAVRGALHRKHRGADLNCKHAQRIQAWAKASVVEQPLAVAGTTRSQPIGVWRQSLNSCSLLQPRPQSLNSLLRLPLQASQGVSRRTASCNCHSKQAESPGDLESTVYLENGPARVTLLDTWRRGTGIPARVPGAPGHE